MTLVCIILLLRKFTIKVTINKKYLKLPKTKLPYSFIIIFVLFLLVSLFSVLRDASSSVLRPFGFTNQILAQFTNAVPPSRGVVTTEIPPNGYQIIDSYGRCQVINPDAKESVKRLADTGLGSGDELASKAGINQGTTTTGDEELNYIKSKQLNMSYIISLYVNPSEAGGAVGFIKNAQDAGFMPIIRMCFIGGCGFQMDAGANYSDPASNPILRFYNDINNQLAGTEYQYVAMVGPNEPGTGTPSEMSGFFSDATQIDYPRIVAISEATAAELQEARVINGGSMYLAPAAFNIPNKENNDVQEYITRIDPSKYDVLIGNTYNLNAVSAYNWYVESGMRDYVASNDLLSIITEFGSLIPGDPLSNIARSYAELCEDDTVDGILFFRPNKSELTNTFEPRQSNPELNSTALKTIISSCDKQPQLANKLSAPWLSCNFDSCIDKTYQYPRQSRSEPVAEFIRDQSANRAWLRASCNGGSCTFKQQNTMQVSLPIKSLGSNTVSNSAKFKSYPPVCNNLADQLDISGVDILNQFAGKITDATGKGYPVPWLGSLINCLSEISLSMPEFEGDLTALEPNYHPASLYDPEKTEVRKDLARGLANPILDNSLPFQTLVDPNDPSKRYVPDEKTICLKNEAGLEECFEGDSSQDLILNLRDYNPFELPNRYFSVKKANGTDLIYLNSKDDFLQGPEVITLGEASSGISASELCWLYGQRALTGIKDFLKDNIRFSGKVGCTVDPENTSQQCRNLFNVLRIDGNGQPTFQMDQFQRGRFQLSEAQKGCFFYNGAGIIEKSTQNYGDFTSFYIEGIEEALYRLYLRFQTILSKRNLKMVFAQDVGWQVKQDLIIRDANREFDNFGEYLFVGEYTPQSCEPVEFFGNNFAKSRGSNIKTKYEYYSWLGYLDIIQEWIMAYTNNSYLSGEELLSNPFYNRGDPTLPNAAKKKINVSGIAARYLSFPILTCDQVNICKNYSNEELFMYLKTLPEYRNLSDEDIRQSATELCHS